VILVVQRMGYDFGAKFGTVLGEVFIGQGLGPAYQFAVNAAALAPLAGAVLHGLDLHVVPVLPKRRENAAVMRHVPIPVGSAFPDAHRGEVGRLKRSHVPLIDPVVGDPVEADLAVGPGLHAGPFDAVVKILCLAWREMIDEARRAPCPA
jgi:hypothetical protein